MSETIKVKGLQELNAALASLSSDVQRKYLRGAVAAGARVVRDAAMRNVPIRTGTLKRAIYSKWIQEASGKDRQTFLVSVRRGKGFRSSRKTNKRTGKTRETANRDAYYWTWVEFGHVTRGAGQRIKGGTIRRERARTALRNSGQFVPPRPFLRPAFESNKSATIEAIRAELAKRIAEGVRK